MKSGGFPGLQNQCDLTASGRVGSIPIHSRQLCRHARAAALLLSCILVFATAAAAQKPDTTRARGDTVRRRADTTRTAAPSRRRAATPVVPDSLKPPLSPRQAFLYSALIPGFAQAKLGRNKAAAVMLTVEAMAIAMIRESQADVREARSMSGDSVVVSYVGTTGDSARQPLIARRFDVPYVHVRQAHVEDWVAFLVANHLFSGADAFVAANLWDVPAQLQIRVLPGGATIGAKLTW
jgi:hypothetical protein